MLAVEMWLWAFLGYPGKQDKGFQLNDCLQWCVLAAAFSQVSLYGGAKGSSTSFCHLWEGRARTLVLFPLSLAALSHGPLGQVVFSLLCCWGSLAAFAF